MNPLIIMCLRYLYSTVLKSYDNYQLNLIFLYNLQRQHTFYSCNHGTGNQVGILESIEGTGSHLGTNKEFGKP